MNEKISDPYPFRVGRTMGTSDLPGSDRQVKPRNVAHEWQRVMWSKAAPNLQRPVEEARPFGRSEHTPAAIKWLRMVWARRWSRRRAERLDTRIQETENSMTAFMTMAHYAIDMAVKSEPLAEVQTAKRRELMNRWRNTYGYVFGKFRR